MRLCLVLVIVGLVLSGLFGPLQVSAQEAIIPESEYLRIREMAFDGHYSEAVVAARKLVNRFPLYGDARILLGRVLAWQKNFKEAAATIDTLLSTDPDNAVWNNNSISLFGGRNEVVAFQLIIQSDKTGADLVNVAVSDLKNGN